jgi:hypothetical protein
LRGQTVAFLKTSGPDRDGRRARRQSRAVLNPIDRPDFGYPGAWLATPEGVSIIHIHVGGAAMGADGRAPQGAAAIDHVSITATDFHGFIAKFKQYGLDWRDFVAPAAKVWQLVVYDPRGVQLEITFDADKEQGPPPDVANRGYVAGKSFFKIPTSV